MITFFRIYMKRLRRFYEFSTSSIVVIHKKYFEPFTQTKYKKKNLGVFLECHLKIIHKSEWVGIEAYSI